MSKHSTVDTLRTELARMPKHMRGAGRSLAGLGARALRLAKDRPGPSLLGAFAAGFVLAKLARFT